MPHARRVRLHSKRVMRVRVRPHVSMRAYEESSGERHDSACAGCGCNLVDAPTRCMHCARLRLVQHDRATQVMRCMMSPSARTCVAPSHAHRHHAA
ncbi:hypothetical protein WT49_22920 [Burkholderia territorii]|nr:hypothetical protein WS79_26680 [Burkholderia territorii]KWE30949.1 hypothetical protein WT49_22920 [Burkholderia territorii]KWE48014.1 hypothetical protein WT50_06965 [Burkholderia territorii]KWE52032.1 hypothetical protein WT51_11265 [Burkholderia territorii]